MTWTFTTLITRPHGRTNALRSVRATRLCRTIARPAIANERLKRDGSGDVVLQLKSAWRDGTMHIRMSPLDFMQRLAPRPRLYLIRFHGALAPNAGRRAAIRAVVGLKQSSREENFQHTLRD